MFKATIPLDDLAITGKVSESAIEQVSEQDRDEILSSSADRFTMEDYKMMIIDFCQIPRTSREIQENIGIRSRPYLQLKILKPMLEDKTIVRMQASKNSKNQKYMTNNRNEEK